MQKSLEMALLANSYFRARHQTSARFKRSRRLRNDQVTHYAERVSAARRYIRLARELGWRGSIVEAAMRGDHRRESVDAATRTCC